MRSERCEASEFTYVYNDQRCEASGATRCEASEFTYVYNASAQVREHCEVSKSNALRL
jgi:hypothetical protein